MSIASVFRPALIAFALVTAALIPSAAMAQGLTSTAADGFNPNTNGTVFAVAQQSDGKILLGGLFTTVEPTGEEMTNVGNLVRLNGDGRVDVAFTRNVNVNGQIQTILVEPDGQILIGGKFTQVNGQTRRRLARLNADGTLDVAFDPNIEPRDITANPDASLTPEVMALALQLDGKIVVGGGFKFVQPNGGAERSRNRLARFNPDGTLDETFDPNANSIVLSLAIQADGKIVVGGGFTTLNPAKASTAPSRQRIARLNADGSLDAFDPQANNAVNSIQIQPDGKILIAGSFSQLKPNGGTAVTAGVARIARLDAAGAIDTTFTGQADGPISVIKLQPDGGILVGGAYSTLGGLSQSYLGRLLPAGGLDTSFYPSPNAPVYALEVQGDGSVILGGAFRGLRGQGVVPIVRNHVARVSFRGTLDNDFRPDMNGRLRSLVRLSDGTMLVGGSFTSIAGQTRSGVVRVDANGAMVPGFRADVAGTVLSAVRLQDGRIVIGGLFSQVNGERRMNLARLDANGVLDKAFDPAPNGQVNAILALPDGKLLIGGAFTQLSPFSTTQPVARGGLARINADGGLDLTFTAEVSAQVMAIVAQADNKILLGGNFTAIRGSGSTTAATRNAVARLNTDGSLDTAFNPNVNGTVSTIVVQGDKKILLGGSFVQLLPNPPATGTVPDPVTRNNLARVNEDGTLDGGFDPNVNGSVASIVVQSTGHIVFGGRFSGLRPAGGNEDHARYLIARVTSAGAIDPNFNVFLDILPGNEVVGLALAEQDRVVIAGAFTELGVPRIPRARLARINADGTPDAQFNSEVSTMSGATINTLTTQFSGAVLVGGEFAGLAGTGGYNFARFNADGSPDTTVVPNINGPVRAMAEAPQNGKPITTQRAGFAWLTSTGELQPGVTFGSEVSTMTNVRLAAVFPNGDILVSATVTTVDLDGDGDTEAGSLIKFKANGTIDRTFKLLTTGTIYAMEILSDGKILIGGTFTKVGDLTRNNLARLNADGTADTTFEAGVNNTVQSIVVADGKYLIGGNFTSITPNSTTAATARNYLARVNTDGTLDTAFDPRPDSVVQAIVRQSDGKLVVGGFFSGFSKTVNNTTTTVTRNFIARLNSDGTVDESVDLKANGAVAAIATQRDGKLVVAGAFSNIGAVVRNAIARLNPADLSVDAGFNPNANQTISSVAIQADDKIVIAGSFTALQPGGSTYNPLLATPRNRLARLNPDGTIDTNFNPNFNSQVISVTVHGPTNTLIVLGAFTSIQPFGSLLVGGEFTTVSGVAARNLALFSSDGSISSAFQPNPNGAVHALLTMADGRTVVGGAFTEMGGTVRNRLARITAANTLDTGFNPNANGTVYSVALLPDGRVLVGGEFTTIGGVARAYLARLGADGQLDTSFAPTLPGRVTGVAVQPDGRVLVLADGSGVRSVLLRVMPDGSPDGSFVQVNGGSAEIAGFVLQSDGKIVVGGAFTTIAGQARSYVARLNADGTVDPTFTSAANAAVTALAVQRDGKILIGGRFTMVDGLPRFGIARIATPTSGTGVNEFAISQDRTTITWVRRGALPEISSAYFETSKDLNTWTVVGNAVRVAGSTNWQLTGAAVATDVFYVRASAIVPTAPHSSSGLVEAQGALVTALPRITSATVVGSYANSDFYYAVLTANGATTYGATGLPAGLTINSSTGVISGRATTPGMYQVLLTATNSGGTSTMPLLLIVGAATGPRVEGSATDAGANIRHPNGNTIDQFLLTGTSATLRADPGEVVRLSFVDLDNDIVQVEFSGAGRFTLTLAGASGPAAPAYYNQPNIAYMKGHATISVVEADQTTHLSVFSVGRGNAVNSLLFRSDVQYDGIADIAAISIASSNGRFGGLRCANAFFFASSGTTGLSAAGVQFAGPVYIGDISAFDTATPSLVIGSASDRTLVNGGDLLQANGAAVTVAGLARLEFVNGETSHRVALPAQANKAVLRQNGVDVTSQIVVNP